MRKWREGILKSVLNRICDGNIFVAHIVGDNVELQEASHVLLLAYDTEENSHSGLLNDQIIIT